MPYAFALLLFLFLASSASASQSNVVAGEPASWKEFPFIGALVESETPSAYKGLFCGGSLIGKRTVLTAAHCAKDWQPEEIDVVLRRSNLKKNGGKRIGVRAIKVHGNYNDETLSKDLALLRLEKSLPGPYPTLIADPPEGETLWVAGWGWAGHAFPARLQKASATLLSDAECLASYNAVLLESMFCTDGVGESCSNDSGGPITSNGNLYGIVSWGAVPCRSYPSVYAKLDLPWIKQSLQGFARDTGQT